MVWKEVQRVKKVEFARRVNVKDLGRRDVNEMK